MSITLDQSHFKCPLCGSLDMEIEIDCDECRFTMLDINLSCQDCNQNRHVSQYSWSLKEFEQLLREKLIMAIS